MRIIGGDFKGQKILLPKDSITRPLKDIVKESIFNILNHSNKFSASIEDSNILDLFSGIGSFGIEALSRKAHQVTFIENYSKKTPLNRLCYPNEVSKLALYIISSKASYISGSNLIIDGGISIV